MNSTRREVSSRQFGFFHQLASRLVKWGLTPNQVSVSSAAFALVGGICFSAAAVSAPLLRTILLIAAILCIQLRLICNLIDGLMAVECGLKTASGEIFNDLPDRISDVAFILGAGVFAQSVAPCLLDVAWLAALFAVLTAYIRVLGAAMTGQHDFSGPMAKQHRMFLLTLGALGGLIELLWQLPAYTMSVALFMIGFGSLLTCVRRVRRLYVRLESK
jgi:phosphatidylglycerophosphate synthase